MIMGGPCAVRIAHPDRGIPARDNQMCDPGCGRGVESDRDTTITHALTGRFKPFRGGDEVRIRRPKRY